MLLIPSRFIQSAVRRLQRSVSSRRRKRGDWSRPSIEQLEHRTLLSVAGMELTLDGILEIEGTDRNERIYVNTDSNGDIVVDASFLAEPQTFDVEAVRHIRMNLHGGSDRVYIDASVEVSAYVDGGAGNDLLNGGSGNDVLIGGDGDDRLSGGDGDDRLKGDAGNDALSGGDGNDRLRGDKGHDGMKGGDGDDVMYGGSGHDRMKGGKGNDVMFGGKGNDDMDGGYGADILLGEDGDDVMDGAQGRDILIGGNGSDLMQGGRGDDLLIAGTTDFDGDDNGEFPLGAIMDEWNSEHSYKQRIKNLSGVGDESRLNGDYFLLDGTTVHDDGAADVIDGGSESDWYFHSNDDTCTVRPDEVFANDFHEFLTP